MPGGSGDFYDEGDESNERDAMPTASLRQWATTELVMFDRGTRDVDGLEGEDGDDADRAEEALHDDDRSTQNVED
jgi:hypothetical protein